MMVQQYSSLASRHGIPPFPVAPDGVENSSIFPLSTWQ
jgi:hypothetical protein